MHLSRDPADLAELREAAEYLAAVVPPEMTVATTDIYLAVESGRRVPSGWEMGIFSYFPAASPEDEVNLNLLTPDRLAASLRELSVGAVALSDRSLGMLVSGKISGYRPFRRLGEEELIKALPALERFRLDRVFEDFGQFKDRLYVLLPAGR